jgi:hypothetical protein
MIIHHHKDDARFFTYGIKHRMVVIGATFLFQMTNLKSSMEYTRTEAEEYVWDD